MKFAALRNRAIGIGVQLQLIFGGCLVNGEAVDFDRELLTATATNVDTDYSSIAGAAVGGVPEADAGDGIGRRGRSWRRRGQCGQRGDCEELGSVSGNMLDRGKCTDLRKRYT